VARIGLRAEAGLRSLAARHPYIREIRGAGVIWGLDLDRPAAPVVDAAIQRGLLVNRTAESVIRLLPPYIISAGEIDEALGLLDAALVAAFGGPQA
jgi:acetylornithine/succinyldiaminopimelate/putrescine aminotransferase